MLELCASEPIQLKWVGVVESWIRTGRIGEVVVDPRVGEPFRIDRSNAGHAAELELFVTWEWVPQLLEHCRGLGEHRTRP
jgi:hypothetical protein